MRISMSTKALHQLLDLSASQFPDRVAVEETDGSSISYNELGNLSDRMRDRLRHIGIKPNDRVGMCLRKSADAVASLFGIMKAGAAYVPVDSTAPASRNAYIFRNCAVKALIVEARLAAGLLQEFSESGFAPEFIVVDGVGGGTTLRQTLEALGKEPARLAPWVAEKKLTVWYSAPSILSLLAQFGKLEHYDYSSLRLVLFAGEVFPIKYLKILKSLWPHPKYFNLYGPTETNVCTFYEVPRVIPDSESEAGPIGKACPYCEPLVSDELGVEVAQGAEGELCIAGPSVLEGYWDLPENTSKAFLPGYQKRWYRTGDIVREL